MSDSVASESHPARAGGTGGGAGGDEAGKIAIRTTSPAEVLRHNISDEELDMLAGTKRENLDPFMWAMFSLATGALPAVIVAVYKAYWSSDATPLALVDLFQIVMVVAGLSMGLVALFVKQRRSVVANELVTKIRSQGANPVTVAPS